MSEDDQERKGETLTEIVHEGWVKEVSEGEYAIIEIETPQGRRDLSMSPEEFPDGKLPEYGRAIRYRLTLETAPDLETTGEEEKENWKPISYETYPHIPGKPGHYKIGE